MPESEHPIPIAAGPARAGCMTLLLRVIWIMAGNVVLAYLAIPIYQHRGFSLYDLVYWLVVATLLLVRFADIRYAKGLTTDGTVATMKDWRHYAVLLASIAGGAWAALHIVLLLVR